MRQLFERFIRLVGIVVGATIIVSCTAIGATNSFPSAIAGFVAGAVIAVFTMGWVYCYHVLRKDIGQLSDQLSVMEQRQGDAEREHSIEAPTDEASIRIDVRSPS